MKILTLSLERKIKSIIPLKIKTSIVNLITSEFVGYVIKLINPKFNFFNGFYDYKYVSNKEAALIFFGIWVYIKGFFSSTVSPSAIEGALTNSICESSILWPVIPARMYPVAHNSKKSNSVTHQCLST